MCGANRLATGINKRLWQSSPMTADLIDMDEGSDTVTVTRPLGKPEDLVPNLMSLSCIQAFGNTFSQDFEPFAKGGAAKSALLTACAHANIANLPSAKFPSNAINSIQENSHGNQLTLMAVDKADHEPYAILCAHISGNKVRGHNSQHTQHTQHMLS